MKRKRQPGNIEFQAIFKLIWVVIFLFLAVQMFIFAKPVYSEAQFEKTAEINSSQNSSELIQAVKSKMNIYFGNKNVGATTTLQEKFTPPIVNIYGSSAFLPPFPLNMRLSEQAKFKTSVKRIKVKCRGCGGSGDCSHCGGRGKINFKMCPDCNGSGYPPGECTPCGWPCWGSGKIGQTCTVCNGKEVCTWCWGKGKY